MRNGRVEGRIIYIARQRPPVQVGLEQASLVVLWVDKLTGRLLALSLKAMGDGESVHVAGIQGV